MSAGPAGSLPPPPPVRIRIDDAVVARIAARCAIGVPGVVALQADLEQTLSGAAGSVLGPAGPGLGARRPPPAGAVADVRDGAAAVALVVVTRLGYNCRDLAQAVQREVAAEIAAHTGLAAEVTVTIAEIVLE